MFSETFGSKKIDNVLAKFYPLRRYRQQSVFCLFVLNKLFQFVALVSHKKCPVLSTWKISQNVDVLFHYYFSRRGRTGCH